MLEQQQEEDSKGTRVGKSEDNIPTYWLLTDIPCLGMECLEDISKLCSSGAATEYSLHYELQQYRLGHWCPELYINLVIIYKYTLSSGTLFT